MAASHPPHFVELDVLELRFASPGDPNHALELDLRYRVLRAPIGHPPGSERYAHEEACLHLVALDDGRVVGCVLFHPSSAERGRLLQMAVEDRRRGQGLGRRLVGHLERELRRLGTIEVVLHAREVAVGFYERLGYVVTGEPFEEVGLPHRLMVKRLI